MTMTTNQPPSGGCVLKLLQSESLSALFAQPPSGGCVLKLLLFFVLPFYFGQPPSGGCVLKPTRSSGSKMPETSRLRAAVC